MTKRITISLDEKIVKALRETAKENDLKISTIVRKAVEEYLCSLELKGEEADVHPQVVWRIRGRVAPRGPSPRMGKTRAGAFRIVNIDELQIS